jgi:hypothetical protein
MGVIVIACYRPNAGQEAALAALVREHLPILRRQGLVTERLPVTMRAGDGTVLEVFEWKCQAAIDQAHQNPAVQELWGRFAAVADYTTLAALTEASQMFAAFTPLDADPGGNP